nr:MAG TPA: hypothetical protein [Caudoviricetes sp.]
MIVELLTLTFIIIAVICNIYVMYNLCDDDFDQYSPFEHKWVKYNKEIK